MPGPIISPQLMPPSPSVSRQQINYKRLWWIGLLALVASLASNITMRTIAGMLFPIPSTFTPLTWERLSLFTLIGVVGAVGVFALVGHFARHPRRTFLRIAVVTFVLSFIPNLVLLIENFIPDTTLPGTIVSGLMHVPPALFSTNLLIRLGYTSRRQ